MGWGGTANRGVNAQNAHVCNCIGCCEKCGMCRTDGRHSVVTCEKMQAWLKQNPLLGDEPTT
jgi:hypothetical protein